LVLKASSPDREDCDTAMTDKITVALAQLDLLVGDVAGNTQKILDYAARARDDLQAHLIVFPELSVCGYPPEDLLFHSGLRRRVESAIETIRDSVRDIAVLVGFPEYQDDDIFNACVVFKDGKVLAHYRKHMLPNYSVFDEKRYFTAGTAASVFTLNGVRVGLNICEDVWASGPTAASRTAGAEVLIAINGSPYELDSQTQREEVVRQRVLEIGIPAVYLNMVGGQDELVFDGGSFAMDSHGDIVFRAAPFSDELYCIQLSADGAAVVPHAGEIAPLLPKEQSVYEALVCGTRDYVGKHGFPGVVIGLSGGVDSALILAIACDALGAEQVRTVMMPFRYTSTMSQEDAAKQAKDHDVRYDVIPIEPIYEVILRQLEPIFGGRDFDVTEENIQARIRGLLLMAISNKTGRMLLTTGNKSEMAVGYATLYGDMAGGFAPIKDCSKSLVYELARYRNTVSDVIPERVITRAPSAELRPHQKDSDSLPDYDILDPILEAFIEEDLSVNEIVARGFDREVVIHVLEMVKRNEYKRRQAPPGIRISGRAFGRDWRYPITSSYTFPE
jgi:NAD+ synthase (glutamine-hydrolysing)